MPLDHSVTNGPVASRDAYNLLLHDIVAGGADAIVVHKGRVGAIAPEIFTNCSLIVHLSASTRHAPDSDAKILVGDVEDAVRLGADAVSVHVNVGSRTEQAQLADLGSVASSCGRWNLPLVAMMYARGPRITDSRDPEHLAHIATIAADLGADIVKIECARPVGAMADVVASCPVPIVVAGGAVGDMDLGTVAAAAMGSGCRGLAVGRRVFTADSPRAVVRMLSEIVHGDAAAVRRVAS